MESPQLENLYETLLKYPSHNQAEQIIGKYIAKAHGNLASCLISLQQVAEQLKELHNSEVLEHAITHYISDIKAVQDNITTHFVRYFNN